MKEHALPQDITSYRFHIIGNMTLKQFLEVGAGCVVGFLIYTTNLPQIIKWPLILLSAGIGALAAFVPFEERPLDQWLVALFQVLYRPTQFFWQKNTKIPDAFLFEPKKEHVSAIRDVDLSPLRHQRVKEFLNSIDTPEVVTEVDNYHAQRMQEVSGALEGQDMGMSYAASYPNAPILDQLNPTDEIQQSIPVIGLDQFSQLDTASISTQQMPIQMAAPLAVPENQPIPQMNAELETQQPQIAQVFSDSPTFNTFATPQQTQQTSTPAVAAAQNRSGQVVIPKNQNVQVTATFANQAILSPDTVMQVGPQNPLTYLSAEEQPVLAAFDAATVAVTQNNQLPFPDKPTEPNKVVGMVVSQANAPIANAIVEVVTPNGMPARAVKTNILGQFFVTTPLNNGTYTLLVEKDGFQFSPQQLTISGQIIDPIELRSLT